MNSLLRRPYLAVFVVLLFAVAGCGGSTASGGGGGESSTSGSGASGGGGTLTLYSGQHEQTTQALVKDFTKKTGIEVRIRSGEDTELASQVAAEGSASPADVFFAANSPALTQLSQKGLLAKADQSTLNKIPPRYNSPSGTWAGITGRAVVLTFNSSMVQKGKLPGSIMDLSRPEWKGKVAISKEADFIPVVTAVRLIEGPSAAKQWLEGLKRNAEVYNDNEGVLKAVNDGQVATGILNNYYWFRQAEEVGAKNMNAKLYYFGNQDPGALLVVSGAGVLKSSDNPKPARKFVDYLASKDAQRVIANSTSYEYTLNPEVQRNPKLKPLDQLNPPKIDLTKLGKGQEESLKMMQQAGLL